MSFSLNDIRTELLRIVAHEADEHPSNLDASVLADAGLIGLQQQRPTLTVTGCWFLAVLLEPDRLLELERMMAELGDPALSAIVDYALDTNPCPDQIAAQ